MLKATSVFGLEVLVYATSVAVAGQKWVRRCGALGHFFISEGMRP